MPKGIYKHDVKGEKNPSWKGEKVGYFGVHQWLYDNYGKANLCEHCGKKDKKYNWCCKNKLYKRNREDYMMLCISCHAKYDFKYNGRKISPIARENMRKAMIGKNKGKIYVQRHLCQYCLINKVSNNRNKFCSNHCKGKYLFENNDKIKQSLKKGFETVSLFHKKHV